MPGFPEPHRWGQECLKCAARVGYTESSKTFVLQRETLSQKLKKGDKGREGGKGKGKGQKEERNMARVKGMCI